MEVSANKIRFSVLDQSPIREGGTAADAIRETVELAQRVESLGYHRYWLAEHHGTDGLAGPAPEIMVTRVAAATREMRVGSGGVMLSHYSPYKVAENFKVLENMYPGRIDLGIGRAPGSDQRTAIALAYGSQVGIEYFPAKIRDMAAFLDDTLPKDHPLTGVTATPRTESVPEIWILASSEGSTTLAARYGMGLSYAHFINPSDTESLLRLYRESFQPSAYLKQPALTMRSSSFAPRPKPRRSALSQAGTSTACAPTGVFTAQCQARRPPSLTRSLKSKNAASNRTVNV